MAAVITLLLAFLVLFGVIGLGRHSGPDPAASATDKPANGDLREALFAARWLVWLGGAALALGGGFLVKYSIEHGFLSSVGRVTISGVFGLALIAAGELTRRRPGAAAVAGLRESTIPAALTAAGLVTCYAAVFGAHALYGLIGPLPAFMLLAAVSGAAVLLSLLHGSFIGVLGLAGAYAVPLLVSTREPSALALFSYLGTVNLAALAVVRLRRWWWLGWIVLVAGGYWLVLYSTGGIARPFDLEVCTAYALLFGLSFAVIVGTAPAAADGPAETGQPAELLAYWGAGAGVSLVLKLAIGDGLTAFTVIAVAVLVTSFCAVASAVTRLAPLALMACAAVLFLLLAWPYGAEPFGPGFDLISGALPALVPPHADTLAAFAASAALLCFTLGLVNALAGRMPILWASVSAGMPVAVLLLLYGRFEHFQHSVPWSWSALSLAAVMAAAACIMLVRHGPQRQESANAALAAYLVGVTAGVSLAFAMRLEEAWLTAALALQLPALAWVENHLRVSALRSAALLLAIIIIVRLLFNPGVLGYTVQTEFPFVNWITWGYGLSAVAVLTAARIFSRVQRDVTVDVLQAAGYVFTVAFATLQVRVLMHDGNLAAPGYGLLEASLNTASWFAIAYTVYRRMNTGSGPAAYFCTFTLFWAAVGHFVLVQLATENPIFTNEPVGADPIFNLLFPAYALPALFAALFLQVTRRLPSSLHIAPASLLTGGFCGALVLYEGLEVRRFFHGEQLGRGSVSDSELYAYSAVWLVTALLIMAAGFWRRSQGARFAGLALLTFVALKVFVYDMSGLTGLLRVVSFIGLGVSLIGIGFIYQRTVLTARKEDGAG